MKAFIIGGAGFVGKHLIEHLKNKFNFSIAVSKLPSEIIDSKDIEIYDLNILDKESIKNIMNEVKPDYIFHLAALSSVLISWKSPSLTIDINVKGTINVLDAVRECGLKPRILLIGSGEEYGHVLPNEIPILETNTLRPANIYAASKVCQGMIGKIYADAYNMDIIMVRAFNHIGPGQTSDFVVANFCKQVAEIECFKLDPLITVGNLLAKRDFTDVRDVVCAYCIILENGKKGETYNVGRGKAISVEEVLKIILSLSSVDIKIQVDKLRFRPVDIEIIEADLSKLKNEIKWTPEISIFDSILDTLNFWRETVKVVINK